MTPFPSNFQRRNNIATLMQDSEYAAYQYSTRTEESHYMEMACGGFNKKASVNEHKDLCESSFFMSSGCKWLYDVKT